MWYIVSLSQGAFIGECLGLGFFQSSIADGECSPQERPVEFDSQVQAQEFLDSWSGGASDCYVTNILPPYPLDKTNPSGDLEGVTLLLDGGRDVF